MPDHPSWRLLPVAVPGIPNLLVSTTFSTDSYKVHLTDLANVWVESMERKPIFKRGLVEDTSIDPSDGPDQLRRMFEVLQAAFDTNKPEHANTSLTIESGKDDALVVHVTCILPKPLKPFKWPMTLTKCPHSSVVTQLMLPLITAHEARTREIDELVGALGEKDAVITKLVDKLEATGIGLEHVFNALSGKRKVSRAAAESKVKGLAPFSESRFRSNAAELQGGASPTDVSSVLDGVFGGATGLKYRSDMDLEASPMLNDWWSGLSRGQSLILADRSRRRTTATPDTSQRVGKAADDDDDFQIQATPPGLASARKRATNTRPAVADDSETSDGEDIPDSLPLPSLSRTVGASGSRLGTVGGHKNSSPPSPQAATPPRQVPSGPKLAGSSTASETASDNDDVAESPPKPPSPKSAPRRGGLGRIGGKAKEVTPATEQVRSPSPVAPKISPTPPRRHKLGVIGKKSNAESSPQTESPSESSRGRSKTPAAAGKPERLRETSEERADRKRAELQRELERRAAAAPAKKKRKF
ncbi:hypothetical protein OQA88_3461 [Cercophora sp. LCS_1]